MHQYYDFFESPIGRIKVTANESFVTKVEFVNITIGSRSSSLIEKTKKELLLYFNGRLRSFSVPILLEGSDFQKEVWEQLRQIKFGELVSYKDIAERINNPKASRSVGNANNKNKISIIVPCHRIIGSDGGLKGYAAGLWRKKWLIQHEKTYSKS